MRAVVQRVDRASVSVDDSVVGETGTGLLVFLGVAKGDTEADARVFSDKVIHLRIFEDSAGKMNHSLLDVSGDILLISQFTLLADCSRGRRPSFVDACEPESATVLYEYFVELLRKKVHRVSTGRFQAMMKVESINHGPVTMILDTKRK